MNVFFEFHKIVQHLQSEKIRYALIGGVAMAYHAYARFTNDIDILVKKTEIEGVTQILEKEGYTESAMPWKFKDEMELRRFLKIEDEDEMIIDILVAGTRRQEDVIDQALEAESEESGIVKVATKGDLIWLKSIRNSPIDQADIETLKNENEDKPD